jgi:leucyl/phenylalanyl-tRNA---protein transferase
MSKTEDSIFPHPSHANEDGVLAVGGSPTVSALMDAYQHGIFPWPMEGLPLLWFSPDPRFVIRPHETHISKSLRKTARKGQFSVHADRHFEEVIERCSESPRPHQDGTWITDEMIQGYIELHQRGFAHSIEAYFDDELVGGLYGVSFGAAFFGESMFAVVDDASKIAFITLLGNMASWGFHFIDCQVHTDHLARFGAHPIPREHFLEWLKAALKEPTKQGNWELSLSVEEAFSTLSRPPGINHQ